MRRRDCCILILRVLQLILSLELAGMCSYVLIEIISARNDKEAIYQQLKAATADSYTTDFAKLFVDTLTNGLTRISVAFGASCWAILFAVYSSLTSRCFRKLEAKALTIALELFTMLVSVGAVVSIAWFTADLMPACRGIDNLSSVSRQYPIICPISRVAAPVSGITGLLFVLTSGLILSKLWRPSSCTGHDYESGQYRPLNSPAMSNFSPRTSQQSARSDQSQPAAPSPRAWPMRGAISPRLPPLIISSPLKAPRMWLKRHDDDAARESINFSRFLESPISGPNTYLPSPPPGKARRPTITITAPE